MSQPTVKDLNLELTKLKKNFTDLNHKYELLAKKCVDLEAKCEECNNWKTKTFSCTNCNETFKRKKDLQKHREQHSDVGVIQCKDCDNIFDQEWKIKAHIKNHKSQCYKTLNLQDMYTANIYKNCPSSCSAILPLF